MGPKLQHEVLSRKSSQKKHKSLSAKTGSLKKATLMAGNNNNNKKNRYRDGDEPMLPNQQTIGHVTDSVGCRGSEHTAVSPFPFLPSRGRVCMMCGRGVCMYGVW